MNDPVSFLCDILGMYDNRNARHSPQSILDGISSGQLHLDPKVMATTGGADVLNKLVSTVRQRGIGYMQEMDKGSTLTAYEDLAARLIEAGANPWMAGRDGQSPWELAVSRGWEGGCVLFLQHPARLRGNDLGNGGTTQHAGTDREYVDPWIVAASRHDMTKVLAKLLQQATVLDAVDFTGSTALHAASSLKAVEMLLAAGIDPEIRNSTGKSAEERWIERTRQSGGLDAKEARLMSAALLIKRMEHGDPRAQAADMVAEAGEHMGVRDGEPLLRKAGWKDPKNALTSKGVTIFAVRAEDALNRSFTRPNESLINASDLVNRITKITSWLHREQANTHDQGLARLMMWHVCVRDPGRQWHGARHADFLAIENKIKLPSSIAPVEQQKAIDSLKDAVGRGTIGNGSYLAATALMGVLAKDPTVSDLFASHENQDPLLIQWLDLTYKGMTDPAWNKKGAYSTSPRPDSPLNDLLTHLQRKLPAAGDDFWMNPKLPGLFLRLFAGFLVGNNPGSYTNPMACSYAYSGNHPMRSWDIHAKTWLERMDAKTLLKTAESDPVSGRVLKAARDIYPEVIAMIDQVTIDQSTAPAMGMSRRRGL